MKFANTWAWSIPALAVFALGGALGGALMAQNPATPAPTPANPITTKPEGTGPTCSYSVSRGGGKTTGSSTCPPANAAQRFPYPGEASVPADGGAAKADTRPAVDGAQAPQPNAAQKFPYPGETTSGEKGSAAGAPGAPSPLQDAGSSGASSHPDGESSSSSSSSNGAGDNPFADDPADKAGDLPAPKRGRKKLPQVARQSPDEREEEDVKVAAFYQDAGNFRAAYGRAKDALAITETDPEAHFILAEAARKLGKLDEALQHYKRCLELDPLPKQKKETQKALKEMAGS